MQINFPPEKFNSLLINRLRDVTFINKLIEIAYTLYDSIGLFVRSNLKYL